MRKILVTIPTSTYTQRQLLEGLLAYTHEKKGEPWLLHLDLNDLSEQRLKDLKSWHCDGIIAYILSDRERRSFAATGLPAVFIEPTVAGASAKMPRRVMTFVNDHAEEGRTAADYFLKLHFRHFAYIGTTKPTVWSAERSKGYAERLAECGFVPLVYSPPRGRARDDFALESRQLVRWLGDLPKPTALFCVHDRRAQQVIATAQLVGIRIPEDISILGVDNDELLCNMTVPAISSIPVGDHERGRLVGEALEALMAGRKIPRVHISRHASVISRRSTDATAIGDPFLARAISYAKEHLPNHPTVDGIAAAAGCSRTLLNRRARSILGHSFGRELARIQLDHAANLLRNTKLTVEAIATESGFCGASHLGVRIKAAFGTTPRAYRCGNEP